MRTALLTGAIVCSGYAWACECVDEPTEDAKQHAKAIFQGRVIHIEHLQFSTVNGAFRIETAQGARDLNDHTLVTFEVTRYWKGTIPLKVRVYATARPSMCDGYRFEQGREYILYTGPMTPGWPEMEQRAGVGTLYEVADCPGRIVRENIHREARWLGRWRAPRR